MKAMPQQKVVRGKNLMCISLFLELLDPALQPAEFPAQFPLALSLWDFLPFLPVSLTHATEEPLCGERLFPLWDRDLYSWLNLHKFASYKILQIKPREKQNVVLLVSLVGGWCTGRPGGSESWEQCSVLWGWFSMCRFLSIRKQRSCSGLLLELFGLTGNKETTHCSCWWTKSEQRWWHHLPPRFLCNFKSSPWPGWTQAGLWTSSSGKPLLPDVLPTSWPWWHKRCNLSGQKKWELPASQKNWSALGTASLLLYCSVGCNSCTLRVISVHFWRLLCETSFSYWT